jgi:hypothetical protein
MDGYFFIRNRWYHDERVTRLVGTIRDNGHSLSFPCLKAEIRVMVLLKGRQEDALDCKLSYVCLKSFSPEKWKPRLKQLIHLSKNDKPHSYEALSYVWGSPSMSDSLRCDGKSINITLNLRDALRRLRLADRHRALWVDQICINQSDTDERSSQVALMDRIYKMTKQVVAWLGPDPDEFRNPAYKFLVGIAQGKIGSLNDPYLPDNARLKARDEPRMDHAAWKALDALISLSYFTRTWIL